jgi:hypothetical protein
MHNFNGKGNTVQIRQAIILYGWCSVSSSKKIRITSYESNWPVGSILLKVSGLRVPYLTLTNSLKHGQPPARFQCMLPWCCFDSVVVILKESPQKNWVTSSPLVQCNFSKDFQFGHSWLLPYISVWSHMVVNALKEPIWITFDYHINGCSI